MDHSSIQVSPRARRRLARYKVGTMTYEDVLSWLMEAVPPEDFRRRYEAAHEQVARGMRSVGGRPVSQRERIQRMTPGERMEAAFELFRLAGGRP